MKKCLCLLLTLLALFPGAQSETDWTPEDWAMTLAALSSAEENPVPQERRLAPLDGRRASGGDWLRLLLLSTDTADLSQNFGRTDAMVLCAVNLKTGETRMVSLPEESRTMVPGLPEPIRLKYVNCFGGPLRAMQVLETELGLSIPRYCAVNFSVFEDIVDALGGIEMSLEPTEREALGLDRANQRLNGTQALRYARMRRQDEGKSRPLLLLEAILRQAVAGQPAEELLALVDLLLPAIDTNLSTNDLMALAFAFCEPGAQGVVASLRLSAGPEGEVSAQDLEACRDFLAGEEEAP